MRGTPEERYRAKFIQRGPDECWPWIPPGDEDGYGQLWVNGRYVKAHRFGWTLENDSIPCGLHVLHSCDTPPCQNPRHWFLGTNADNMADKTRKGRQASGGACIPERLARGEAHGRAKRTAEIVHAIRAAYAAGGQTQKKIGLPFGISQTQVSRIVRREIWRQI